MGGSRQKGPALAGPQRRVGRSGLSGRSDTGHVTGWLGQLTSHPRVPRTGIFGIEHTYHAQFSNDPLAKKIFGGAIDAVASSASIRLPAGWMQTAYRRGAGGRGRRRWCAGYSHELDCGERMQDNGRRYEVAEPATTFGG